MSTQKLNIFDDFGTALKEALVREGKSSAWLSRKTGKDKGQISKYINGNTVPREITQRELTAPLSVDIVQTGEGEWKIISSTVRGKERVQDTPYRYSADSYEDEKKKLKTLFDRIRDVEELFEEFDQKLDLNEKQKRMQIEMIREKIADIFRSELEN